MHWFRNMDGVVMLGFGLLGAIAFAGHPAPAAGMQQAGAAQAAEPAPAMVVVVSAKRLSAAEKRAFDLEKRS